MSKLEKLINELCPDGVEYQELGDVCKISAGGDVPKNRYSKVSTEKLQIPIISNGIGENALYGYTDIAKISSPCITIAARGTIGYCSLWKIPFYPIIRLICAIPNASLDVDFLYYFVQTIRFQVPSSGIPQLTVPMVGKYKVPIPPLPVQQEIVRILDNFTELTAELIAELTARKKQYEYYRSFLLSFKKTKDPSSNDRMVKMVALDEIATMLRGEYITKKSISPGNIPVILGGQEPAYYCHRSNHVGEVIVISRSGAYAGFVSYWDEPIFVTDGFMIETRENIRYLYHYLKNIQDKLHKMKRGGGVPHVRGNEIMKIKVPLPSLDEQTRIAKLLDRFDSLCNDLTSGLPAEIEARRKQYEYYRDKLLTFKEAK